MKRLPFSIGILLPCLFVAAACGGGEADEESSTSSSGGAPLDSGVSSSGGSSSSSGGGSSSSGGAQDGGSGAGYVYAYNGAPGFGNGISAQFGGSIVALTGCHPMAGSCEVCNSADVGAEQRSAGTVSLQVAGAAVATVAFSAGGYQPPVYSGGFSADGPLWSGGETAALTAAGDDVPAFSTTDLVAPTTVAVSVPEGADEAGPPVTFVKTDDLVFEWSGGVAGDDFRAAVGDSAGHQVRCYAPASAGTLTIPHALLETLTTGSGTANAATRTVRVVDASGFAITEELAQIATDDTAGSAPWGLEIHLE